MNIDTLSIARELRAAALPPEQAEAIATAIGRAVAESSATKGDLDVVKAELKAEMTSLKGDLRLDLELLSSRFDGMQKLMSAQNEATEERLGKQIEGLKSSVLIWLVGVVLASAGLVITAVRYL